MLASKLLSLPILSLLVWPVLVEPGCQAPAEPKGRKEDRAERHAQKPAAEAPPAPGTIIAPGTKQPLSPPLWGYNAANLFNNANGSEPKLHSMIDAMGTRVLRFPGGTLANFYHPDGKGYGLRSSDVELVKGSNMYKSMGRSVEKEASLLAKGGMDIDPLTGMIALSKATGVQVLYVANLFSGTDDEVLKALRRLRDGGVTIAGVELGNEHYLRAYKSKFPDVKAYLERAERTAKAIRAEFPKVPLGIVVAPPPDLKGSQGDNAERLDEWNAATAGCGFADAMVLHTYAFPKGCKEEAQGAELFTCMNGSTIDYVENKLPKALGELKGLSGGKKAIWVTEWNMHAVFEHFGNTLLQGLFAADMMFAMSQGNGVTISTCHNLLADGDGFNAISVAGRGTGAFNGQVLYHVSAMLKDVLVPGATVQELGGGGKGHVRLVTVPSGARYVVVTARGTGVSAAGMELPAGTPLTAEGTIFGAEDLMEGVGDNPVRIGGRLATRTVKVDDVRKAEVPPFGLAVFRLGT